MKLQKLARKVTREKTKDPLNFIHIQIAFFNLKLSIGFGREWARRVSFKQSLFFWSKNHQHQHLHSGVAEQRRSYKMHTHTDTDKRQARQNLSMTNTDSDRLRQTWEQVKCEKKITKHAVTCRWDSSIELEPIQYADFPLWIPLTVISISIGLPLIPGQCWNNYYKKWHSKHKTQGYESTRCLYTDMHREPYLLASCEPIWQRSGWLTEMKMVQRVSYSAPHLWVSSFVTI